MAEAGIAVRMTVPKGYAGGYRAAMQSRSPQNAPIERGTPIARLIVTPDGLPLVGQLAPGLFINAGHGFNGWRDAGITAQRVAALIAGGDVDAPAYVEAWAPARFNL